MYPQIPCPTNALILLADLEDGMVNIALDLQEKGVAVTKVAFKLTDYSYRWRGIPCVRYDAPYAEFRAWLRAYVREHGVDTLILYNEARPYNEIGWELAAELGIECLVFELGLLRPNYCSVYSSKFHHAIELKELWKHRHALPPFTKTSKEEIERPDSVVKITKLSVRLVINRLFTRCTGMFRHQVDKRSQNLRVHLKPALNQIARFYGRNNEDRYNTLFETDWDKAYYVVPLQVHYDAQITDRSKYGGIEEFIDEVTASFMANAPDHTRLIFKVHPMDRGYVDYAGHIEGLSVKYNTDRLYYVDRIHLPTALEHALGCITVNSTVGLSALLSLTPTITMGTAVFDLEGLTFQGELDDFWTAEPSVTQEAIQLFLNLLKETTQAQGVIYQQTVDTGTRACIHWPPMFQPVLGMDA